MKIFLNLLPEEQKKFIARRRRFHTLAMQLLLFFSVVVIVVVILLSLAFIVRTERASVQKINESEQGQDGYQKLQTFDEAFQAMNQRVVRLTRLRENHVAWTPMFGELSRMPDGITITALSTDVFALTLEGTAETREALLAFQERLTDSACFSDVVVPLTDLVVREDINFTVTARIEENCLRSHTEQ